MGIFATTKVNSLGVNGLLYGNAQQLVTQLAGVAIVAIYTFIVTRAIYGLVDFSLRARVCEKDESVGLDLTQHKEQAYTVLE